MNIQNVRSIAKGHGLKTGRMTKAAIIRTIQRTEGNFDCFGSATDGICDQQQCTWRDDCLASNRKRKS